jgi:hypothetical protein
MFAAHKNTTFMKQNMYVGYLMLHMTEYLQWEISKERDYSEVQGVDGRMGSEWILGILAGGCGLDSTGSG